MKKYSAGKKLSIVAIHQMFMVFLTTGIYASGYCMKHDIKNGLGVYTFLAIVGMVGSFVTLSYMANTSGRRSEDDYTIYYRKIDKIYSDIFSFDVYAVYHWNCKSYIRCKKPEF